jgi:hypothetical protein
MTSDHDGTAEALDALDPSEEEALSRALVAAVRPEPISDERHQVLLEGALLDPLADPSADERERAEALRAALETGAPDPEADLARALAAAFRPAAADAGALATRRAVHGALPRSKVIAIAFAATAALSLAAGVVLVLSPRAHEPSVEPELAESRSLSPLFARAPHTTESERLDRIVAVRSRELRDNRFASWGVR